MDKILFQVPATIQSVRTLADGGIKLDVLTQELAPAELTLLFQLKGKLGWFVFSESGVSKEDIPEESVDIEAGEQSPSQRLRNILYVYWKDHTSQREPFDVFYRKAIDREVSKVKDKML